MRALSRFVGMFAFLLALPAFVAMLSASCGKSDLVKAYESYDAVVDPLLARDIPLWGKLVTQFNEQLREETADLEKFGARVRDEAVPFYSELPAKVAALAPSNRDLARAHEWLVKYAASRAAFVRFLAANLDVLDPGASMESLSRRQNAAQQAVEDYEDAVKGQVMLDPRFGVLRSQKDAFAKQCMEPFTQGRMSKEDVSAFIERQILPQVRALGRENFAEDQASQLLRAAIFASEEFYASFAKNLPHIDDQVKFGADVTRMTAEGDDLLKEFRDEMAAVRRRM